MIPRAFTSACVLTLAATTLAAAGGPVRISEVRIDQPGFDTDEYFEVKGPPSTNLAGYFYVVIGNDDFELPPAQNGSIEEVVALSGTIPASGVFTVANASFTLATADQTAAFSFDSDNNKTHLLVQGFTGFVGQDLDTNDDGVLDIMPWTSIGDSVALIRFPSPDGTFGDFVYSTTEVGPDAGAIPWHAWTCSDTNEWRIGFFVPGVTDTPTEANPACEGEPVPILISEIRIDETGTDNSEYFELSGEPGASLDDLTYIVLGDASGGGGGSGAIEAIVSLAGRSINSSGLFLAVEPTFAIPGAATPDLVVAANGLNFENGDNVTHMLVRGFTGASNQDLDTNNDGVLDLTPWAEIVDWVSLIVQPNPPTSTEWAYSPTTIGPDGIFVPGHVYRCQPNGDWRIGNFDPPSGVDSPGLANLSCDSCGTVGGGNCFLPHATGGCEDAECCETVCDIDPTCCSVEWDAACVTLAQTNCHEPGDPPALVISEVRIDQPGNDTQEFLELRGAPGASLNGVAYVVIGDSTVDSAGVVESVTKFSGSTLDGNGYFVVAKSSFSNGVANLVVPNNGFTFNSNSSKTHLLVWNNETVRGQDLDADNDCTLDLAGWVAIIDQVVFNGADKTDCRYGAPLVGPDCGGFVPAHLYRCDPTDEWTIGSFDSFEQDTAGATNTGCDELPPLECGDPCAGDCFTAHEGRACNDPVCCAGVCGVMPECCDTAWDQACADLALELPACGNKGPAVTINEIRIDQPGSDVSEYFELKGEPGTSLDGVWYLVIGDGAGQSGIVEEAVPLSGLIPLDGLFLAAEETFVPIEIVQLTLVGANPLNFENDDNVTHMLVWNFSGKDGDDLDTNDDGTLDAAPWDQIMDWVSVVKELVPTTTEWYYSPTIVGPEVGKTGDFAPGQVYRCLDTGDWAIGQFDPTGSKTESPSEPNPECMARPPCPTDFNDDGMTDGDDLGTLLGEWGKAGGFGMADFNNDGMVDGDDLGTLLGFWGPCPV
ncbi:MAG: hypothetical protein FJ253_01720 [Phycisphaerae bacterium]|nr:hypothetical protein [Phycisphaerae bacterium]